MSAQGHPAILHLKEPISVKLKYSTPSTKMLQLCCFALTGFYEFYSKKIYKALLIRGLQFTKKTLKLLIKGGAILSLIVKRSFEVVTASNFCMRLCPIHSPSAIIRHFLLISASIL
jgi:hypothetical protein